MALYMKKYKVAVIGLGMVGMTYDNFSLSQMTVFSHSKAFSMRSDIYDVYGVDGNSDATAFFEKKGYGRGFLSIDDISALGIDIYVLAVQTSLHYELALQILDLHPKVLLIEKPISYKLEDSRNLVLNFERTGVSLFVNYFRRSLPEINNLKKIVKVNREKKCSCYIFYSGGVFNIASHFIDLLIYLFGELFLEKSTIKKRLDSDFSVEFNLSNEFVDVSFTPLDVNYKLFNVEIFFDNFMVTIDTFGSLKIFDKGSHPILNIGGYLNTSEVSSPNTCVPQKYVVDNLHQYLMYGTGNLCSGREALKTEDLISQILRGA